MRYYSEFSTRGMYVIAEENEEPQTQNEQEEATKMETRNGSGYIDPTANGTQLFSTTPMDGEIWKDNIGNEYLVLRAHEETGIAQVLKLWTNYRKGRSVKVTSRQEMYTNPEATQYMFYDKLTEYVKDTTQEEYLDAMQAVGDALGVKITVSGAENEAPDQREEMLRGAREALDRANEIISALREQLDNAIQEKVEMRMERDKMRERLTKCCEKLIDLGCLED